MFTLDSQFPYDTAQFSTGTEMLSIFTVPFCSQRLVLSKWRTRLQTTALEPNQDTQQHLLVRGCHICVHTDTALCQSIAILQPGICSLTHKISTAFACHGLVLADSLLGQERGSYQVLHCCVIKRSSSAVCSVPGMTQTGRIYIQFLGGARSPPNNFLQNT